MDFRGRSERQLDCSKREAARSPPRASRRGPRKAGSVVLGPHHICITISGIREQPDSRPFGRACPRHTAPARRNSASPPLPSQGSHRCDVYAAFFHLERRQTALVACLGGSYLSLLPVKCHFPSQGHFKGKRAHISAGNNNTLHLESLGRGVTIMGQSKRPMMV